MSFGEGVMYFLAGYGLAALIIDIGKVIARNL